MFSVQFIQVRARQKIKLIDSMICFVLLYYYQSSPRIECECQKLNVQLCNDVLSVPLLTGNN